MKPDELRYYLEADRLALGRPPTSLLRVLVSHDPVWKFQVLLRCCEQLYKDPRPGLPRRLWRRLLWERLQQVKLLCGFSIPLYTFGPGLSIAHYGTIVVNEHVRVGKNCRLHADVNIGAAAGTSYPAPQLGDNIYIGPGAKIYGPIVLADDLAIGANSVVNRSFEEPGISIAGSPARKISDKGSRGLLVRACELL